MEQSKHTPGKWHVDFSKDGIENLPTIYNDIGSAVAMIARRVRFADEPEDALWSREMIANGNRIVTCVNMHDDLVDALKGVLTEISPAFNFDLRNSKSDAIQKALQLIKQAEQK